MYLNSILIITFIYLIYHVQSKKFETNDTQNDDNWKRDLYTNRTLHLDQDPLHVAYARRRQAIMSISDNNQDSSSTSPYLYNCSKNIIDISLISNQHRQANCHNIYDCELCQLLQGYKTLDAIEILSEIIKILETQESNFVNNPCRKDNTYESPMETSCVIAPFSWKL